MIRPTLRAYAARAATDWDRRAAGAGWVTATGSLAKVDLSGFTRLSERLARSEVTGAEGLNTVLNDVFLVLIEEVLARGGDVLQFGGDALLVWFTGADHALRAVASCRAMQRALALRPAERTAAGPVRLRMSAGIASGEVVLTVVGADHRELITLGPTASRVEQMEKDARSGEVLIDAATAARLRPDNVRPAGTGAFICRGAPREVGAARSAPAEEGAEAFVPPDVRRLKQAGIPVGEHRRSAVAFIGVSGTDELIANADLRGAVSVVARVATAVDEAVRLTRVVWTATDLMADGAVFLLFAGAPMAREDDEERMLRACRVVADRCADLGVRIGAHAGRVFAADIGHPERRTYAIIGDTTNLAARLMHRAAPGTVLVSDELYARSDHDHVVEWQEAVLVKGRRRPVVPGVLGSRTKPRIRRRTHDLPLVGRTVERENLVALLDTLTDPNDPNDPTDPNAAAGPASPGPSRRLAIVGDAGAGKSRLVEEALRLARERGTAHLHAAANAFDTDIPYGALRQPLRTALAVTDDPAAALARLAALAPQAQDLLPLLGLPLGLDFAATSRTEAIDPQFLASRRNELLAEVLGAAVAAPLLVLVEDLHDLDRASAGLLDALAQRTGTGELALLVTSRVSLGTALASADAWRTLRLEPLQPGDLRELALATAGERAVSDLELHRMIAESGGNPLFLRELVAFAPTSAGTLPTSAEEVVAARIDTLGPVRRQLLRDAAVGGPVQRLDDLAHVLANPTVADPARWSGLADFVSLESGSPATPDGPAGVRLSFRHDLYRRSAYGGLAVRRRRELHAAFADHLVDSADSDAADAAAATIAVHLHESQRFTEAWHWALRAARSARAVGAFADAAPLYVRAIDAGTRADTGAHELGTAQEEFGDTAELLGAYGDAEGAFRAAARVGADGVVARRLVKRATVLERQGRYRVALGLLTRAEHRLPAGPSGSVSVTLDEGPDAGWTALALRRSSVLHRLGRRERAYSVAAGVAARIGASDLPQLRADRARALLRLEMLASEGGWPERFELGAQALAAFDGLDEDRDLACLLGNLGATAYESDDWSGARSRYEEATVVYRRAGDVIGAAIAANNAGEILCEQGHLERSKDVFVQARRVFRAAGHAWGVACTASSLGRVAARSAQPELASALLEEAYASLSAMGSTAFAADARVRQVEAALLAGVSSAALARDVLSGLDAAEVGGVLLLTARRYLAIATAATGELSEAQCIARDVRADAHEARAAHEESLALDLLAGLALLSGAEPEEELLERRDLLWQRLGVVASVDYPPIPRAQPFSTPMVHTGEAF